MFSELVWGVWKFWCLQGGVIWREVWSLLTCSALWSLPRKGHLPFEIKINTAPQGPFSLGAVDKSLPHGLSFLGARSECPIGLLFLLPESIPLCPWAMTQKWVYPLELQWSCQATSSPVSNYIIGVPVISF